MSTKEALAKRAKKVASVRGDDWRKKLVKGKFEAKNNPSLLYQQRVKKGLTQTELAQEIGASLSTYGGIERGMRPVKGLIATALAKKLRAGVEDLFAKHGENKMIAKKMKN